MIFLADDAASRVPVKLMATRARVRVGAPSLPCVRRGISMVAPVSSWIFFNVEPPVETSHKNT